MNAERLLQVIRRVLGAELWAALAGGGGPMSINDLDALEFAAEPLWTFAEDQEFAALDARLGHRRDEFYTEFNQSPAEKESSWLHWHNQRYSGDYGRQLRTADAIATRRGYRARTKALKAFLGV